MAATKRQEREMKLKYEKLKDKSDATPLERLRAYVLSKGVRSLKQINMTFKRIDQNHDGKIEFSEFHAALQHEGIYVEKEIERQCFDEIDYDHIGFVNLDEFILAMRPPMPNCRKTLIKSAFEKLDRDKDGEVSVDDLRGVYSVKKHPKYLSGEWTEDQCLTEWLSSFHGPGGNFNGIVTYEDFENYYAGVSASIDSDAYFDLMMRHAWKL